MNRKPIKNLTREGSVQRRSAHDASGLRYFGFTASVVVMGELIWMLGPRPFPWVPYGLASLVLIVLWRPWHRSLHVEMDSPRVRVQLDFLGFLPVVRRHYDLTGKQLTIARRTEVVEVAQDDSASGCLAFILPFPFSLFLHLGSDAKTTSQRVTRWVLCTWDPGTGATEDLLLLEDRYVGEPFLDAAREVLPDHVAGVSEVDSLDA